MKGVDLLFILFARTDTKLTNAEGLFCLFLAFVMLSCIVGAIIKLIGLPRVRPWALRVRRVIGALVTVSRQNQMPYSAVPSVLTGAELAFYQVLNHIVAGRCVILAKLRLADLVRIEKNTPNYMSWFGRISQKHADFVLCDPRSLRPLLVIELDDRSHRREDRMKRDTFVDECLHSAEIGLLRVRVQRAYDVQGLTQKIEACLVASWSSARDSTRPRPIPTRSPIWP